MMLLAGASIIFLTSCEDDGETTPTAPTITLTAGDTLISADGTVSPDTTITVSWTATKGDAKLESFDITVDGVALAGQAVDIDNADNEIYVSSTTITVPSNEGTYTYELTVTDKDDVTGSVSITITVEETVVSTPFTSTETGQFYHVGGSLKGAYSLVTDEEKSSGDPDTDKSMINNDAAGATFTGSFTSGDGTMYVKAATSFDYDNATVESATAAYAAGTASTTVTDPAANDVYIALNGSTYMVVKITAVDATDDTCGCLNTGKISISYKK